MKLTKGQKGTENPQKTPVGEVKTVRFEDLHKISRENSNRFNRNVWTEKVQEDIPSVRTVKMSVLMGHHYHRGRTTTPHYRCLVKVDGISQGLYQDLTEQQWKSLVEVTDEWGSDVT